MSFIKEVKGEKTFLKIEGSMSIYEAAALREACMECFKNCEAMEVDLSGVSECDITGVQLLYSARMTAEATEKIFEITAVSPAVIETMVASGLNL
jgi:anti-anti-sigma factor